MKIRPWLLTKACTNLWSCCVTIAMTPAPFLIFFILCREMRRICLEKCTEFCPLAESVESVGSLLKKTFLVEFILTSDSDRSGEEGKVCLSQI